MRQTNRRGQGVRRVIRFWDNRQAQNKADHFLNLLFFRAGNADDGLFYRMGGKFGQREVPFGHCQRQNAAGFGNRYRA
jgi:hypothetical protein